MEHEIRVYSIIKYFHLLADNNPNMVDTIFVPQHCITQMNAIGQLIRNNRHKFLHKGCYHRFTGYAHSQLHKMSSMEREGKRKAIFDKFGFDVKFAMHLVRLCYECEQILTEGDLDLQRHSEHLKAIVRGDVPEKLIRAWFEEKEPQLLRLYHESKLPHSPNYDELKELLFNCLEHHFGSLDKCVSLDEATIQKRMLNQINAILEEGRKHLG